MSDPTTAPRSVLGTTFKVLLALFFFLVIVPMGFCVATASGCVALGLAAEASK